jgi:hypothetical protein
MAVIFRGSEYFWSQLFIHSKLMHIIHMLVEATSSRRKQCTSVYVALSKDCKFISKKKDCKFSSRKNPNSPNKAFNVVIATCN